MKIYENTYYIIKNGQGTGRSVGFLYSSDDKGAEERKLARLLEDYPASDGYTLIEESVKIITTFSSYYLKKNFKRL